MSEELPIRYAISIIIYEDSYHGIIYNPATKEYSRCSNPNLTKLMNLVSSRIRAKEKVVKNFPLPVEQEKSLIIMPNGS